MVVQSLPLWVVAVVNLLAALLIVGYLHLANLPDPEHVPEG